MKAEDFEKLKADWNGDADVLLRLIDGDEKNTVACASPDNIPTKYVLIYIYAIMRNGETLIRYDGEMTEPLGLKAELQQRLSNCLRVKFDPLDYHAEFHEFSKEIVAITHDAIDAITDEPEKPFIPTGDGPWWWKEYPNHNWQIINIREVDGRFYDKADGDPVDKMGGEWWPKRILRPR